jgi:ABC-type uncharacterized transport system auxiliary subunit
MNRKMMRDTFQALARGKRSVALGVANAALAALLAAACGAARPSKYYQLTVPADTAANPAVESNPYPVTLLVGRITASELYREDPIVYSSTGEAMGTYEYHRWAEPPIQMIPEILLRELRASGRYRNVVLLRSDVHGDFLLHGHLYDFKEVEKGAGLARVTLELELRNVKTGTVVWTHFYSHDEPATGKNIDAIVEALDKDIQRGVTEFRASLDEYFATHPPAQSAP